MSFRQFGGLNYAAKHNIVSSNYNTSNNLLVTQNVGQPNSYINFLSDISGNISVYGDFDLSGNLHVGGDIDCSGSVIANEFFISGPLVNEPNSVVPKSYVDAISGGFEPRPLCKCATTTTISGTYSAPGTFTGVGSSLTIDQYPVQNNDRVLVKNQGTFDSILGGYISVENGIYIYNTGAGTLTRSSDMAASSTVAQALIPIQYGQINSSSSWIQILGSPTNPRFVGTNTLKFILYADLNINLGQGLNTTSSNGKTFLNVDSSLNFINFLDNTVGPNAGTLNIGTNTTNNIIIGPTGGINVLINGATTFNSTTSFAGNSTWNIADILLTNDATIQQSGATTANTLNRTNIFTANGSSDIPTLDIADIISGSNMYFLPNAGTSNYNPATDPSNLVIVAGRGGINPATLELTTWSATNSAVKIKPTSVVMGAGGTSNIPTTSVECNGTNVLISGNLDVSGNGNFTGSVTASSFNATSDYRIKDNIQILNEYHNVDNLRPITYLNKKTEKQDIGLLAHELQEQFPCLVTGEKDAEEFQTVNYTGLIPILIKEIQELKKEIKLLKEMI